MRAAVALALLPCLLLEGCPDAPLPPPPPGSGRPQMGINLSRATYYSPAWVFVDAFKLSRYPEGARGDAFPWDLEDPQGLGAPALDGAGYPLGLGEGQRVEALCLRGTGGHYPAGVYTLSFVGDGAVELGHDAHRGRFEHDGQGEGRFPVEVEPSDAGIRVRIVRSNPADHVRDLRLIMPGFEETHATQPFHPLFLERLAPFGLVRFMDWGATNGSPVRGWGERRTPDYRTQDRHGSGVAYEWMLDLANALQADPWLCVPHLADDDHVARLARLVAERLGPDRTVWIEYSNEVWNGGFQQAQDVRRDAEAAGASPQARYARRSLEVFAIFARELGGTERLKRVLGTHLGNPRTTARILEQVTAGDADVLAVGLYVGGPLGRDGWRDTRALSPEQVLDATLADVERRRGQVREARALAQAKGLRLVAYEGGQHLAGVGPAKQDEALSALFDAANRHPRMGQVYEALYDMWEQEGGDAFCHYSHVYRPSQHGRWGLLEHQDQDLEQAPKYAATVARALRWSAARNPPPAAAPR